MFRSRHGVPRDEDGRGGEFVADTADHRGLDRADIRHDRAVGEVGSDALGGGRHRADRHCEHDKLRIFHGIFRRVGDEGAEPERAGTRPDIVRSVEPGYGRGEPAFLDAARNRGADQSQTDDGDLIEQRFAHAASMKAVSASIVA